MTLLNTTIKCSQPLKNIKILSTQNLNLGKIQLSSNTSIPYIDINGLHLSWSKGLEHKHKYSLKKQTIYKKEKPPQDMNSNDIYTQ